MTVISIRILHSSCAWSPSKGKVSWAGFARDESALSSAEIFFLFPPTPETD
jgi:hypothetical protein